LNRSKAVSEAALTSLWLGDAIPARPFRTSETMIAEARKELFEVREGILRLMAGAPEPFGHMAGVSVA
jgi:hypothetical protein